MYGSGTLALSVIALLRHLYPDTEVWAVAKPGARADLATRLGAHAVLSTAPDELVAQVAKRAGAVRMQPWSKRDWLQDGPAVVYDTIGSPQTVETSLRLLAAGGSLVVSGVEPPKRFEWTPLYFKELRVIGSNGFGIEQVGGVSQARDGALLRLYRGWPGRYARHHAPVPAQPLAGRGAGGQERRPHRCGKSAA